MRQKVPFVDSAALVSSQYQNFRWKWSRKKTVFPFIKSSVWRRQLASKVLTRLPKRL